MFSLDISQILSNFLGYLDIYIDRGGVFPVSERYNNFILLLRNILENLEVEDLNMQICELIYTIFMN